MEGLIFGILRYIEKESAKNACKFKRENGKMQLMKSFARMERWIFISDNLHLKYQTLKLFSAFFEDF